MSWTTQVVKGGEQRVLGPRIFLYGLPGVGKSSFASKLPKPISIDYDEGIDYVNIDRLKKPKSWEESLAIVRAIATDPQGYKSLVIDTVDPLEEQAVDFVLKTGGKKSLGDFTMGAGYFAVEAQWKLFLTELDLARQNGMLVCLLGHAVIREAQDPQLGVYDQYMSALSKRPWQITKRWADAVLFAAWDSALVEKKNEDNRIVVTGDRVLFTERGSGFEAKNRWSLSARMPLEWPKLDEAIARHRQSAEIVRAKVLGLAAGTEYEAKAKAFLEECGDDVQKLLTVEDNLRHRLANPPPKVEPTNPVAEAVTQVEVVPTPVPSPAAVTAPAPTSAPAEPARSSPESIELRIFALAKGTEFEEKAKGHVATAQKDITMLLTIEEALTAKIAELKKNGQPAQAGA